jgi:transcription antitermination factor NusG
MKIWMVATYKINQLKRLQENLQNQHFNFYNPTINIVKDNLSSIEEPLFPGYIFIHANLDNYQKIKYTKGISNIIKFDKNIATVTDEEILELRKIEKNSISDPIIQKIYIGQEGTMIEGPLRGSLITIASLPKNERINIFVHILGTKRKVNASLSEIKL